MRQSREIFFVVLGEISDKKEEEKVLLEFVTKKKGLTFVSRKKKKNL